MNALVSTAAIATATAVPAAAAREPEHDPVFAIIAEHRAATEEFYGWVNPDDRDIPDDLSDRHDVALQALVKASPTTLAGCVALLREIQYATVTVDHGSFAELFAGFNDKVRKPALTVLPRVAAVLEAISDAAAQGVQLTERSPPTARQQGDARLRALWSQYKDEVASHLKAQSAFHQLAEKLDAEFPNSPTPAENPGEYQLRVKRGKEIGRDVAYAEWNVAGEKVDRTIKAIRRTRAESLCGVAIKLAAIRPGHDDVDLSQSIFSALRAAENLTGEKFTRQAALVLEQEA